MSIASRMRQLVTTQPDVYPPPSFGAMSFGGSTPSGYPISSFTPDFVEMVRTDATSGLAPSSIYRTQPAVRICVDFLAENIAQLKLKTYRRVSQTDREYVPTSPLGRLLARPNPRMSGYDLIYRLVADVALYDNAYLLKVRNGMSDRQLYPLPPAYCWPDGGDILTGPARYKLDTGEGGTTDIPVDQVVHIRGYNPLDTRTGQSRLHALAQVIREEQAASEHRTNYFRNAARREGIIHRPLDAPKWSESAVERFREDWRNLHSGASNAGRTAILEDGMTWNADSFSLRDSEFIEGREWALDLVATAYHIPLSVLSRKQTSTFASAKEFHKALYQDTLGPWCAMIEQAFALQLVPEFYGPDLYVEFNIDEKLQGSFEEQADAARNAVQVPYMSVDDMRALRGLRALGGEYAKPAKPANYTYEGEEPEQEPPTSPNGQRELERLLEEES